MRIDEILPRWLQEVPVDAVILVAYTTSKFLKSANRDTDPKQFSISHNLHWAAVLAY